MCTCKPGNKYNWYILSPAGLACCLSDLHVCGSSDPSVLVEFASNIVTLDLAEQLRPMIAEVESHCREAVYGAEEDYEGEGEGWGVG